MNHNLISFDFLSLLDHADEVIEFAVYGPPAAPAAGHVNGPVLLFYRVVRKSTGPRVKGMLAQITGTPFHDNVTLHHHDIVFFCHFILSSRIK